MFRQIISSVLVMFASLSVCAQTDTAATDSLTSTGDESKLVMPNTFTPNGDGHNDIFKAKEYRNLSEFHAYIFNRWGQKLYEWTDPAEGWDGTYHGSEVKTGVYFVLVKARGTDDVIYNIRKDVNLLRGDEQRR
ncbi:gliding motility-associated C-terminal domain-containing protein [Xylanibacter ruminicola]|uniref:Gliding motility-associated C-terminal domain-containing protein n=2 Tax=Xylanibacter ruminicola TaxID=839 RepID=A0A1M7GQ81_XYLRU|nr:gliding motility-associated C-terminal domain-containing protein [Xylanibacter ruminicola]